MNKKIAVVLILGLTALSAQQASSVWDGIFTDDQSKNGKALYDKSCASCHGEDLAGKGQTPPLTGADFMMDWNGLSVGDLYERMRISMPADHPGSLSPEQNADILSFILKSNEFPSGKSALRGDAEALKQIKFETTRPAK